MTTAELLSDLISRGVEIQAHGAKLRFRPTDRLTATDLDRIRQHKPALLALLRAEGRVHPASDVRPLGRCDCCGSDDVADIAIHDGQSRRRECRRCERFLGWPRWYGRQSDPRPANQDEDSQR